MQSKEVVDSMVEKDDDIDGVGISRSLDGEFAKTTYGNNVDIDFIEQSPGSRLLSSTTPARRNSKAKTDPKKKANVKEKTLNELIVKEPATKNKRGRKAPLTKDPTKVPKKVSTKVTLKMQKSPYIASVPKTKPENVKKKADGEKVYDDDSILDVIDHWVTEDNHMLPESNEDVEEIMRLEIVKDVRRKTVKLAPDGRSLIQLDNLTTKTFPVIGDHGLS